MPKLLNTSCRIILDTCEEKTLHWGDLTSFDKMSHGYSSAHKDTLVSKGRKPTKLVQKRAITYSGYNSNLKNWGTGAACSTLKSGHSLCITLLPSSAVRTFFFVCPLLVSLFQLDTKAPGFKDYHHPIYLHLLAPSWLQPWSTGVQKAVLCIKVQVQTALGGSQQAYSLTL